MFFSKHYSLKQSKQILLKAFAHYKKNESKLQESSKASFKEKLLALQDALDNNDRPLSSILAKEVEKLTNSLFPSSPLFKWGETILALGVALLAAIVIRQMWFELYEIPTGSMRPTFKEQDHLTVSKTQFGLNVPMATAHFSFEPDQVLRGRTIIFSGDNLPLIDTDTTFLGVLPYKKRYVKRLIGKPGDHLTFYGGKIFGLDREGKPIKELLDDPNLTSLEHIPFLGFEGQPQKVSPQEYLLYYFYQPLGKLTLQPNGGVVGQIFNGKEWVNDNLQAARTPHSKVETLSDFFGMKGFAMTQLYSKAEMEKNPELKTFISKAPYYLVLRHTPHLDFSKNSKSNSFPRTLLTALPLDESDLQTMKNALYTARFVVEKEKAQRYSMEGKSQGGLKIVLKDVPDGTYEFYHGKAYEVGFGGITTELAKDHPLYSDQLIPTLYNFGIQWDRSVQPEGKVLPSRYAYFRDGALFLLGKPFLPKENERLEKFLANEQSREKSDPNYVAFIDRGEPELTPQALKSFGITVPEKNYLVLGDNHAMSGDSRVFGFVPEDNLQGVPEFIFWPPGDRLGRPAQEPYPTFVPPRLFIWALAAVCGLIYWIIHRRRLNRRIEF